MVGKGAPHGIEYGCLSHTGLTINDLLQVISELFDTEDFDGADKKVEPALGGTKQAFLQTRLRRLFG